VVRELALRCGAGDGDEMVRALWDDECAAAELACSSAV
jgi:hypothetical protein